MFGAYQAGVWDAVSDWFDPDIVIGASVGSLNGYMIASGTPPAELVDRWLSLGSLGQVRWKPCARCLIDPTNLEDWIREMFRAVEPRRRFAVAVTETLRLRPRVFEWPDIGWQHVAASCGVPVFLPAYRIEGVRYSDGGLLDPLPLWAAVELGATEIVAVDLLHRRPLAVRALASMAAWYSGYRRPAVEGIRVIEINPKDRLGTARDSMYWSKENARRWIEMGRRDALDASPTVLDVNCR